MPYRCVRRALAYGGIGDSRYDPREHQHPLVSLPRPVLCLHVPASSRFRRFRAHNIDRSPSSPSLPGSPSSTILACQHPHATNPIVHRHRAPFLKAPSSTTPHLRALRSVALLPMFSFPFCSTLSVPVLYLFRFRSPTNLSTRVPCHASFLSRVSLSCVPFHVCLSDSLLLCFIDSGSFVVLLLDS